jgi:hypothetical protein
MPLGSVADPHHLDADPDPASHFDADPDTDPTFHFDAVPDLCPALAAKLRLKTLKKCSNRLIYRTFWLVVCKLMRIRPQTDKNLTPNPFTGIFFMQSRSLGFGVFICSYLVHEHTTPIV